jgi:hypothetical protein
VGSRAIIHQPKLLPAKWLVTELDDPGFSFTWESRGPGVRVIARHFVETSSAGSQATLSLRFSGILAGLLARLLHELNNRYLALEARGLKQRSEATQAHAT